MKAYLLGYRSIKFTPEGETREKRGLTVYYSTPSPDCVGMFAGRFWVDSAIMIDLYNKLVKMPMQEPTEVELVYEIIPTRKAPVLTGVIFADGDVA